MSQYVTIGGGIIALAFVAWLIWFSYRAGKNNASITTAQAATDSATAITEKAEAMAQAQADKPATEDAVLTRLDGGSA
ncbi:hypothetical protein [Gluconobacter cerinus]|uniref:Uncharacterized protein n=1 Tax=Gluconobacter cerinus TaxID=38307 RepID=A0A1B6VHJ4_9PROT|nr:hypothetical protein [Gluconobacter cerinus]OAJ66447.1 hypothetical protein A0123_02962 [Gluconobacter cerinus]